VRKQILTMLESGAQVEPGVLDIEPTQVRYLKVVHPGHALAAIAGEYANNSQNQF
jgi:hypothetical protein